MKHRTSTVSVLLIALTLMISGLYSCKNNHQTDVPDVAFSTFIKAYTGDRVTSTSSIRIEFTSDVPGQPDPAKILSFSPSIKGQGRWDTPKSLVFIPDEGQLEEGRGYTAKLKLDGIYEISLLGGTLYIRLDDDGVKMTGNALKNYEGEVEI